MTCDVEYYRDDEGVSPVEEVLKTLQPKGRVQAKIYALLERHIKPSKFLRNIGPKSGGAFHKVEEFWQLRAEECRVLAMESTSKPCMLVLLHSFTKKCDTTPIGEINKARKLWNKYLEKERQLSED